MEGLKLNGRVAIVTGSTSGIGEGIAKDFAEQGAKVVVVGRREDKGKNVVEDIKAKGGQATFIRCDLKSEDDIKNLVDETIKTYQKIDILVNNAGIELIKPTHLCNGEEWDEIMNVNGKSYFLMSKYVLPYMMEQKRGSIVNIASVAAFRPVANMLFYCFSKAGVMQMSKSLAIDYAQYGIRVNAIAPGAIKTEMLAKIEVENPEMIQGLIEENPLKMLGEPVDISKVATYLVSDDARYVTGATFVIDGGQFA